MDKRLSQQKYYPRASRFYILTYYEFVREIKPKKMLEIGVQNGASTKTFLMAMGMNKYGTLVSVDHKNRSTILDSEYSDLKPQWNFIKGSSHDETTLQAVKDSLDEGEEFDMIFLDGDHSYEGVKQDWDMYTPLLKKGGVAILHDTVNKNEGVSKLWEEIDWPEKFNCDWGHARTNFIVGLGICKKPF